MPDFKRTRNKVWFKLSNDIFHDVKPSLDDDTVVFVDAEFGELWHMMNLQIRKHLADEFIYGGF